MAFVRRRKTSTTKKKSKVIHLNIVDGFHYKTKSIADTHREWKSNPLVKSFTLPTIGDGQKKSKYGALKAEVNGRIFDSVMEAKFYVYLLGLKQSGEISKFECQVSYELQPKYRNKQTNKIVQPIRYIADFVIHDNNGSITVVDVKGQETDVFKLKKKMFEYKYPDYVFMCVQWRATLGEWLTLEEIAAMAKKKKKTTTSKKTRTKVKKAS